MKLIIAGTRSIQEVQHDFNASYPYLKLEFFRRLNAGHQGSAKDILKHSMKILEARALRHDGTIEITDHMKVADLEKLLLIEYGLNAQVFRKSGNVWLETTMSDTWTLKQQNDHGREISIFNTGD
jgi:uncharacterized protein YqjF (DUF2071 family)